MTRTRALLVLTLLLSSARVAHGDVVYLATTPSGARIGPLPLLSGQATLRVGSTIQIYADAEQCKCTARLVELRDGTKVIPTDVALPVNIGSGPGQDVEGATLVRLRVKVTPNKAADDKATPPDKFEELMIRFVDDTWWMVADTVAYAVTRQSGNTAVAGAAIFINPFRWKYLRPLSFVQYAFAVHLLPPAEKGSAADIGVAPIGIGLFEGRFVAGAGWDISRKGERPDSHNRYVYLGFSASRLLNPKLPE